MSKVYGIPFAYERYGRIEVEAESLDEAYKKAEAELNKITLSEMEALAEYLPDSEEIDTEGYVRVDGEIVDVEEAR